MEWVTSIDPQQVPLIPTQIRPPHLVEVQTQTLSGDLQVALTPAVALVDSLILLAGIISSRIPLPLVTTNSTELKQLLVSNHKPQTLSGVTQ